MVVYILHCQASRVAVLCISIRGDLIAGRPAYHGWDSLQLASTPHSLLHPLTRVDSNYSGPMTEKQGDEGMNNSNTFPAPYGDVDLVLGLSKMVCPTR